MSVSPTDLSREGRPESVVPSEFLTPEPIAHLKLSERRRQEFTTWVCRAIRGAREDTGRLGLLQKLKKWNDNYEGVTTPKNFPWEGASNVHVPITAWTVQSSGDKVTRAVFAADPMVIVKPLYSLPKEQENWIKLHEQWLQDRLVNVLAMPTLGRDLVKASARDGTAIAQLCWRERQKTIKWHEREGDSLKVYEKDVTERGPELDILDLEDFEIIPANAASIDRAVGCFRRMWLRFDELKRGEKEGKYRDVDKLKDSTTSPDEESVRARQDRIEGVGAGVKDRFEDQPFEIYEGPVYHDVNGDGLEELVLATIAYQQGVLLRIVDYPFMHGKPYFHPFRLMRRPNRFYGESMAGKVEYIQTEVNAIHNQRMDATTILLAPVFTMLRSAMQAMGGPSNVKFFPGNFIPVEGHDDIKQLVTGDIKLSAIQEEQMLLSYAEQLTGVTEIRLGKPATGTHTATEIQQSASGSSGRTDEMISCFQEVLPGLCEQLVGLYLQYDEAAPDFLRVPVTYVPSGTASALNEDYKKQQAVQVYTTLLQNPLVMTDMTRLWNVTRDLLNAFGKARDVESYIGPEPPEQPPMLGPGMPGMPGQQMGAPGGQPMAGVNVGGGGWESPIPMGGGQ